MTDEPGEATLIIWAEAGRRSRRHGQKQRQNCPVVAEAPCCPCWEKFMKTCLAFCLYYTNVTIFQDINIHLICLAGNSGKLPSWLNKSATFYGQFYRRIAVISMFTELILFSLIAKKWLMYGFSTRVSSSADLRVLWWEIYFLLRVSFSILAARRSTLAERSFVSPENCSLSSIFYVRKLHNLTASLWLAWETFCQIIMTDGLVPKVE